MAEGTAQAGMAQAQYRLGKMLYQGDFVPKDVAQALEWLRKAAIQGHPYAQYALGQIFLSGEDVPRDLHAASEWFQKAANQGNQYAEQALARIDSSRKRNCHSGSRTTAPSPQHYFSGSITAVQSWWIG